jgi:hypothetical protein
MRPDGVAPATWRVVLSDWYNQSLTVTITLKSGQTFTGKVKGHPAHWLHDMATLETGYPSLGERHVVYNIDLNEVAAVTAST